MATLFKDNSRPNYIIRLTDSESPTGRRAKITCTGMTKKQAQQVLAHVEKIAVCQAAKIPMEQATAEWLGGLEGPIRKRLEELRLISPAKKVCEDTVVGYMSAYIRKRTDIAQNTKRIYDRSLHFVTEHFGTEKKLVELTHGNAKDFDRWLRQSGRKNRTSGLAENTARKMVDKIKTVYNAAIDDEILTSNPFKGIATNVRSSPEKQQFVSADTVRKVIEHAPDAEFKAIIALARFGGLRTPSEFRHLKHGDFSMKTTPPKFTIFCQKTASKGKKTRDAPMFTELWPYLEPLISSDPADEKAFVFSKKYRECTDANIFNTMVRTVKSAGVQVWPDLWRNLRASCESELIQKAYDIKDVCDWLGNTPAVVMGHYLRSNPESMTRATTRETLPQTSESPVPEDLTGDLTVPEPNESERSQQNHPAARPRRKPMLLQPTNKKPSRRSRGPMLPQGLEP